MKVTLYSTGCPRCKTLTTLLNRKNIEFELVEGEQPIIEMGYQTAPILKVDDKEMDFTKALLWIKGVGA